MMAGRVFVTQKPLHASDKTQENFEKKKKKKKEKSASLLWTGIGLYQIWCSSQFQYLLT